MTKVKCTVDSCQFWDKDQVCTAAEIWIRNDIAGDSRDFSNHFINATKVEFGDEPDALEKKQSQVSLQSESARTSPQTCCDTMKMKN